MTSKNAGRQSDKRTRSSKQSGQKSSGLSTRKGSSAPKKRTSSKTVRTQKTANSQKTLTKYQKRKLRRRRIMNCTAIGLFLVVATTLILVFLFRISEIRVSGSTRYTKEQIVSASKLIIGENILTADTKKASQSIPQELPFIESVKIKRKSPTVVSIEVTEAIPSAVYQTPSGFVLLSSKGKILELGATDYLNDVPVIKGISFDSYQVGAQAQYADNFDFTSENIQRVLEELFVAIAKYDFDIRVIDWTKAISLKLNYAETLIIDLGYPENIDEKLLAARHFVDDSLEDGEKGILRVSDPDNMSFTFDPDYSELIVSVNQTSETENGAEQ